MKPSWSRGDARVSRSESREDRGALKCEDRMRRRGPNVKGNRIEEEETYFSEEPYSMLCSVRGEVRYNSPRRRGILGKD